MKRLFFFLFLICIGVGSFLYLRRESAPTPIREEKSEKITLFSPSRLTIPKIGVNVPIEPVGLDKEKRMDVPTDDLDVGWYKYGTIPGEKGSAVIDGHFDTKAGGPAVFYTLSELKSGDSIIVSGKNGEERTFIVTETKIFKDANFPIPLVFSQDDTERLNLITCDGVFDKSEKNYSDRLVVFSTLKK